MSDTTLNRFVGQGTNAERLAFVPDPATPVSGPLPGYFFFETDTGDTYAWDIVGAAWVLLVASSPGTVSTVSVASANGFAGSVANPTTTPAITISTSVTGILVGNGTAVAAAVAGDFPTLNQNTTGSAATLTTPRNINGVAFNGSADITVTAAAGTLTGTTLAAAVVTSSLTSVGTIATGVWQGTAVAAAKGGLGIDSSALTGFGYVAAGTWAAKTAIQANLLLDVAAAAISALDIDWATATTFSKTLAANSTFTFSNAVDGETRIVAITNTASNYTVTWPTVQWAGGTPPVQTVGAKTDVYTFVKIGSIIFGSVVQNFS